MYFFEAKAEFSASLLQSSVSGTCHGYVWTIST